MKLKTFPSMGYKMPRSHSSSQKSIAPKTMSNTPIPFKNPYSSVANTGPVTPSLGQTLKEGLAFGTGQAVAHRVIGSLFAPTTPQKDVVIQPCEKELLAFQSCLKSKSVDDFCGNEQMSYTQCLHDNKK